jgi:hypothetical protein
MWGNDAKCAQRNSVYLQGNIIVECVEIFSVTPVCNIFDTFEPYYPTSVRMCMGLS